MARKKEGNTDVAQSILRNGVGKDKDISAGGDFCEGLPGSDVLLEIKGPGCTLPIGLRGQTQPGEHEEEKWKEVQTGIKEHLASAVGAGVFAGSVFFFLCWNQWPS